MFWDQVGSKGSVEETKGHYSVVAGMWRQGDHQNPFDRPSRGFSLGYK